MKKLKSIFEIVTIVLVSCLFLFGILLIVEGTEKNISLSREVGIALLSLFSSILMVNFYLLKAEIKKLREKIEDFSK